MRHFLSWLNLSFLSQSLQGGEGRYRYGRCFLEGEIVWFEHQCIFFGTDIFGKSAQTAVEYVSEHLITRTAAA